MSRKSKPRVQHESDSDELDYPLDIDGLLGTTPSAKQQSASKSSIASSASKGNMANNHRNGNSKSRQQTAQHQKMPKHLPEDVELAIDVAMQPSDVSDDEAIPSLEEFQKDIHTLFRCSIHGKDEELRELFAHSRIHPDTQDNTGHTPLLVASRYGQVAAMRVLLEEGANPLHYTQNGNSAFMLAAAAGELASLRFLFEQVVPALLPSDLQSLLVNRNLDSILMFAVMAGHLKCAQYLIYIAVKVGVLGLENSHYLPPQFSEEIRSTTKKTSKGGKKHDKGGKKGQNKSLVASSNSFLDEQPLFLHPLSLFYLNSDGLTPLMCSCECEKYELVELIANALDFVLQGKTLDDIEELFDPSTIFNEESVGQGLLPITSDSPIEEQQPTISLRPDGQPVESGSCNDMNINMLQYTPDIDSGAESHEPSPLLYTLCAGNILDQQWMCHHLLNVYLDTSIGDDFDEADVKAKYDLSKPPPSTLCTRPISLTQHLSPAAKQKYVVKYVNHRDINGNTALHIACRDSPQQRPLHNNASSNNNNNNALITKNVWDNNQKIGLLLLKLGANCFLTNYSMETPFDILIKQTPFGAKGTRGISPSALMSADLPKSSHLPLVLEAMQMELAKQETEADHEFSQLLATGTGGGKKKSKKQSHKSSLPASQQLHLPIVHDDIVINEQHEVQQQQEQQQEPQQPQQEEVQRQELHKQNSVPSEDVHIEEILTRLQDEHQETPETDDIIVVCQPQKSIQDEPVVESSAESVEQQPESHIDTQSVIDTDQKSDTEVITSQNLLSDSELQSDGLAQDQDSIFTDDSTLDLTPIFQPVSNNQHENEHTPEIQPAQNNTNTDEEGWMLVPSRKKRSATSTATSTDTASHSKSATNKSTKPSSSKQQPTASKSSRAAPHKAHTSKKSKAKTTTTAAAVVAAAAALGRKTPIKASATQSKQSLSGTDAFSQENTMNLIRSLSKQSQQRDGSRDGSSLSGLPSVPPGLSQLPATLPPVTRPMFQPAVPPTRTVFASGSSSFGPNGAAVTSPPIQPNSDLPAPSRHSISLTNFLYQKFPRAEPLALNVGNVLGHQLDSLSLEQLECVEQILFDLSDDVRIAKEHQMEQRTLELAQSLAAAQISIMCLTERLAQYEPHNRLD